MILGVAYTTNTGGFEFLYVVVAAMYAAIPYFLVPLIPRMSQNESAWAVYCWFIINAIGELFLYFFVYRDPYFLGLAALSAVTFLHLCFIKATRPYVVEDVTPVVQLQVSAPPYGAGAAAPPQLAIQPPHVQQQSYSPTANYPSIPPPPSYHNPAPAPSPSYNYYGSPGAPNFKS